MTRPRDKAEELWVRRHGVRFVQPTAAENAVSADVVDAAIVISRKLGPGLLERIYEAALADELRRRGRRVLAQVYLPVRVGDRVLEEGYSIDVLVDDVVIVEIKVVDVIHPKHTAQIFIYLRQSGRPIGLLINFDDFPVITGIRRYARPLF